MERKRRAQATPKSSFSARIDQQLYDRVTQRCIEQNISQAQLLDRLLRQYLGEAGQDAPAGSIAPITEQIQEAIAPLRDELAELRAQLGKSVA